MEDFVLGTGTITGNSSHCKPVLHLAVIGVVVKLTPTSRGVLRFKWILETTGSAGGAVMVSNGP